MRWHPTIPLLILAFAAGSSVSRAQQYTESTGQPRHRSAGQVALGVPIGVAEDGVDGRLSLQTRVGWWPLERLTAGFLLEWDRMTERGTVVRPSGLVLQNPVFDVFPILGYAQYGGVGKGLWLPYAGGGFGYALGFMEADNSETEIFDGFGWQAWAGIARRVTRKGVPTLGAISLEAAYNGAKVSGSARDPLYERRHDTFDLSSWIVRIGFSFED